MYYISGDGIAVISLDDNITIEKLNKKGGKNNIILKIRNIKDVKEIKEIIPIKKAKKKT